MRFRLLGLAAMIAAVSLLGGCALLEQWGIIQPDVAVKSVDYASDQTNGITSLTILFSNLGQIDENTDYTIVITADKTVNVATDYVVYNGTIDLPPGQDTTLTLAQTDISTYAQNHNPSPPATGDYYVGVMVDVNNTLKESNENNNSATSTTSFHVN